MHPAVGTQPLTAGPEARPGPAARFERQRRARARCRAVHRRWPATWCTAGHESGCVQRGISLRTLNRRRHPLMVTGDRAINNGARRSDTGNTARTNDDLGDVVDHAGEGKGVEAMRILTAKLAGGPARSRAACGGRNRRRRPRGVVSVIRR